MSTMTHVVFGRVAPGGGTLGGEPGEIIHGGGTAHDAGELSDAGIGKSVEDHLIERAHAAGTKALLMLGGNDDGNGFVRSTTSAMRPTFVSNLLAYLVKHDYDGVDIDWEDKIETDTQIGQLIALIKDLKTAASAHPRYASQPLLVTFPTYILNLNTMTVPDWKVEVASLVDQFNIMSYEMSFPHGTWKTAHFAPLYGINRTTHPVDINSTVQEYVKKGIAPSKIGIGIGFYGSSFAPPVTGPDQPLSAQSSNDTEWSYANLVNGGFLSNGEYIWDEVAQMGYRRYTKEKGYPEGYTGHAEYNTSTSGFLSYEDPASINAKGKFVREKNLGGTILWTINYGSPDGINNPLLNAVKQSFILGSDTVQPFTRFTSGMTNTTGLSFTFDGTASTDSGNQPVVSYAWNFGDNQTALGPKPTHTYAREGTYLVSLTVTDANKVSNTMSSTVAAVPPPPPDTMPPLERVPAPNRTKPWVLGYYAGWYWDMYSPEHIDMKAMTHLVFGRVAPGGGTLGGVPGEVVLGAGTAHHPGTLGSLTTKSVEDYVIERAHAAGTKVLLMVGGMFDGNGFLKSSAPGIDHREKFVKNLLDYMELHSYDGVDLDWEDVLDSELSQFRLKALIADLRAGAKKRTRWQAPNAPFEITFPNYAMNMNYETVPKWKIEVAELVDQFNLMSYGMGYPNDGWTTTTFAPLFGQMSSRPMDISSSIKAYQDAGIPRNKLGLGIGFYGMSYAPPTTMPGQPMSTLSSDDNTWSYANLVNGGFLKDPKTYHWDDVAKMGYRSYPDGYKGTAQYNKEISGMLTYEDPRSIAAKGAWVKQTGVGGAIIWVINYGSADGVTNPLLKAVKESFLD
ncbi:MAG TPA: glycosyl hydrolase family 18 protein [Burkholderiaceae bacterium]